VAVDLFDGMPSVGRKFLLAGKGGLNLTHSEPFEPFVERLPMPPPGCARCCNTSAPQQARDWRRDWASTPSSAVRAGSFPPT
jgi:predicted flavoprotein YhiN